MDAKSQSRTENGAFQIIRLDPARQREAADVLARAFFADPLMVYYLPDVERRKKLLPGFMRASLRYCLYYGEVYTTADLAGVACWLPPGKTDLTLGGLIRSGVGVVSLWIGWQALWRVRRMEAEVDRFHHHVMPGSHWYLMILGVEPDRQGQGIGGQLIEPKLAEASAAGLPCYLETMTGLDVRFYRKHGFKVIFETTLQPGDLHIWMMIKHPQE